MHYALKEMEKTRIIEKESAVSVLNERFILANIQHPLIVRMHYAYQNHEKLYILMDLMTGGNLRYQFNRKKNFSEAHARFFIACIILSIEYLHENNIIHRDIKPENLVLDNFGYLHLTDFGHARLLNSNNKNDSSGTPGYMAPEVMCNKSYSKVADFFAIGVIMYEFIMKERPYQGKNKHDIKEAILTKQVQIRENEVPSN